MFLIDKYNDVPLTNNLYFHKDNYEYLKKISEDESLPHLIFNGGEGTGKKTMIKIFLQLLYGKADIITKSVKYTISGSGNKSNEEYFQESNYHIEIYPKGNNNDRYLIQDVVKKYAINSCYNIFNCNHNFKIIVIHNIHLMLPTVQFSLRRTIERYSDKCRFILVTTSLNKIIKPLISRCSCIKLAYPDYSSIIKYVNDICRDEKIKLTLNRLTYILNNTNNLKEILWLIQHYRTHDTYLKSISDKIKTIRHIYDEFYLDTEIIINIQKSITDNIINLRFLHKNIDSFINSIITKIYDGLKQYLINNIDSKDYNKYFDSSKSFINKFNKKNYKKIKYLKKNKLDDKLLQIKESLLYIFSVLKLCTIQNDKDIILDNLIKLILMKNIDVFDEIRNIYFNLMITNFTSTDIITNILIKIIACEKINDTQKVKIISVCKDIEFNMIKGRREINQFDVLIVNIINILMNKY